MLQSVTEYYRVLQSVAECYRVLQSVTKCYRVLKSVTVCYRVFQSITECYRVLQSISSASTWTNFWACFFKNRIYPEFVLSPNKIVNDRGRKLPLGFFMIFALKDLS